MNLLKIFFKTTLVSVLFPMCVLGQSELVEAINSKLIPIQSIENSNDLSDFSKIKELLKNKRIIALGEATHGTHEFFEMKRTLVEYLVKEMGFKVFVIEADYTGAQAMNTYIIDGKGNPIDALQKMGIGVWFTKEFLVMIEWMKKYNETQNFTNKIKFYGCDMQFAINSGKALIDGTVKFKTPLSADAIKGIKLIIDYKYGQVDKSQVDLLDNVVKELNESSVIEGDSMKLAFNRRYITSVLQTIEYAKTSKFIFDKNIIRDERMAENCEWIYNYENKNKMVIWAHNLHIAKNITKDNNLPMGYYLNKKFSEDYYAMGFDFNKGDFRAYNTETKKYGICTVPEINSKKSVEYIFKQCSSPRFFLDFDSNKKIDVINGFLNERLDARSIGGSYNPKKQLDGKDGTDQKLVTMYDGLIFFNQTSAVEMLN